MPSSCLHAREVGRVQERHFGERSERINVRSAHCWLRSGRGRSAPAWSQCIGAGSSQWQTRSLKRKKLSYPDRLSCRLGMFAKHAPR